MANIAKTYTLVNGQPADATQVNKNFDDIISGVGDVTTLRPTVAGLGLDADIVTLALPANTTISPAGAELINDADATAQRATLGAVATGDSRLSDARVASDVSAWAKAGAKPSYTYTEVGAPSTSDARLSNARPASDVSAWAKAASKPSYTPAEVGSKRITTGSVALSASADTIVTHGLGTTPSFVLVSMGNSVLSVNLITSTTFTIDTHATNTVSWIAVA